MALNFPTSPSLNQEYSSGAKTWIWNGDAWQIKPATNVAFATLASNLTGGSAGSIPYQTSADTTSMLDIGASGYFLKSTGTGITWDTVSLPAGQTSGSTTSGYLQYSGTTATNGQINGGTTAPSNTTRLNYEGYLYATRFYGDGSNLTSLAAANLSGTISSTVLGNSTVYIGTTAVALNRASAALALTGISSVTGSTTLDITSTTTNAVSLDSGTTGAINIGTNANAKTITIGNATGATSVVINGGTGAMQFGANAIARTITIGNTTGASALNLYSGTGNIVMNTGTTGTITIDSGTTGAVNIGTNANAKTITIGNTTTTSSLVLYSGTTGISMTTGTTGTITIDSGTTGAINIGTNANAKTITIGSTSSTAVQLPTGKTKIGTTTLAQGGAVTVTLPSTAGTLYVSGGTDIPLADGGTNASLTAVAGGVVYSTASAMAITSSGSSGQVLTSNGTGAPYWSTIGGATLSNDTTTVSDSYYPALATSTSGTWTTAYVSSTKLYYNPSTGQLNATNFNALSDEKYKNNIQSISNSSEIISNMRGVSFNWRSTGNKSYGVIAQEIEKVVPELVSTNNNGEKSVNYMSIIAFLIESNKDLQKRLQALENNK